MSKTSTPKNLTADEAFRMGGKALDKVVRSRTTWTDEAKAVAQAEIDRRKGKNTPKPAAPAAAEAFGEIAEQVDALFAPVDTPVVTVADVDHEKVLRKVASDRAHELAGDGEGHMRRFVKIRAQLLADHKAGVAMLDQVDILCATLEAQAKLAEKAAKAAAKA